MAKRLDRRWLELKERYNALLRELDEVREKMRNIKGGGALRTNATVRLCPKCGGGPFTMRDMRDHWTVCPKKNVVKLGRRQWELSQKEKDLNE